MLLAVRGSYLSKFSWLRSINRVARIIIVGVPMVAEGSYFDVSVSMIPLSLLTWRQFGEAVIGGRECTRIWFRMAVWTDLRG